MPTRRCHSCGEWIDTRLVFCPDCRLPMDPTSSPHWSDIAIGVGGALAITLIIIVTLWTAA